MFLAIRVLMTCRLIVHKHLPFAAQDERNSAYVLCYFYSARTRTNPTVPGGLECRRLSHPPVTIDAKLGCPIVRDRKRKGLHGVLRDLKIGGAALGAY